MKKRIENLIIKKKVSDMDNAGVEVLILVINSDESAAKFNSIEEYREHLKRFIKFCGLIEQANERDASKKRERLIALIEFITNRSCLTKENYDAGEILDRFLKQLD